MSELPKWPEGQPQWDKNPSSWHAQRAEAALARLRVAVEALELLERMGWSASFREKRVIWRKALAAIGEIP